MILYTLVRAKCYRFSMLFIPISITCCHANTGLRLYKYAFVQSITVVSKCSLIHKSVGSVDSFKDQWSLKEKW